MHVGGKGAAGAAAWGAAAALGLAAAGLGGCGERASAVETRDRAEAATEPAAPPGEVRRAASAPASAMTASRRESAEAKIDRLYRENGADFAARSPEDFAAKARAFVERPPAGTERVERPNGDVLLYQASTNTFAVASREGAPRTLFKPRDGAAYWAEQKAAAPTFGRPRASPPE